MADSWPVPGPVRRGEPMSIQVLKPRFQSMLRPAAGALARIGARANHVTIVTAIISVAIGGWVVWELPHTRTFAPIPVWVLLRMARQSVDRGFARGVGPQTGPGADLDGL